MSILMIFFVILDYLWVADEMCEVTLELSNPFPFELEVSNMVCILFSKQ